MVGAGNPDPSTDTIAEEVGRLLAERGAVVVCGGLTGVMEAVCRGARSLGGITVGLLPGSDRHHANAFVDIAIATGMGEMRNALIVRATDGLIAVGGEYGTLSEVAFALKIGKPVVGIGSWDVARAAADPAAAVELLFTLIDQT